MSKGEKTSKIKISEIFKNALPQDKRYLIVGQNSYNYIKNKLERINMSETKKSQLQGIIVDKINLLNRIQIDRIDRYKSILRDGSEKDLEYLIGILNREIDKYPEEFISSNKIKEGNYNLADYKSNYKGFNNTNYTDGNGY